MRISKVSSILQTIVCPVNAIESFRGCAPSIGELCSSCACCVCLLEGKLRSARYVETANPTLVMGIYISNFHTNAETVG